MPSFTSPLHRNILSAQIPGQKDLFGTVNQVVLGFVTWESGSGGGEVLLPVFWRILMTDASLSGLAHLANAGNFVGRCFAS